MYKYLEKLNVKSNLPDYEISEYVPKKFRTSGEICKYDCSAENEFLANLAESEETSDVNKSHRISIASSSATRRNSSVIRNEEIMKSLAALKEEFNEDNTGKKGTTDSTPKTTPQSSSSSTTRSKNATVVRMRAETAGEMYLGVEDTGKFLRFLDFYVNLFEMIATTAAEPSFEPEDLKIVKVFDVFEGDVRKSSDFLIISSELEELGFDEEKVLSALLLHSNDRDAALDFLMKN